VFYGGLHTDAARTYPVGHIDAASARLLQVTEAALEAGIDQAVAGNHIGDIGAAVEGVVERGGFVVVRDLVGHGVGHLMHEEPQVPNHGPAGRGLRLKVGLVIAIEPMVNAGGPGSRLLDDGWTVVTADGSLSAHFEHTVAITEDGHEVLTRR
jgi:methionyl aminopeptidase